MSPEVLIYIQSMKIYFEKNIEARDYFLDYIDEDQFFKILGEMSQKNYDNAGEPNLSESQLELLRKTLIIKNYVSNTTPTEDNDTHKNLYFNTKGFGKIYLN